MAKPHTWPCSGLRQAASRQRCILRLHAPARFAPSVQNPPPRFGGPGPKSDSNMAKKTQIMGEVSRFRAYRPRGPGIDRSATPELEIDWLVHWLSACARTNNKRPGSPTRRPSSRTPAQGPHRRLIEAGGLIEKTGLLDLEPTPSMARCCRYATVPPTKIRSASGPPWRPVLRPRSQRPRRGKEPVVLTFPNPLPKEATAPLRAAGFHFNKVLQHWEGMTRVDDAQVLAVAAWRYGAPRHSGAIVRGPTSEAA